MTTTTTKRPKKTQADMIRLSVKCIMGCAESIPDMPKEEWTTDRKEKALRNLWHELSGVVYVALAMQNFAQTKKAKAEAEELLEELRKAKRRVDDLFLIV